MLRLVILFVSAAALVSACMSQEPATVAVAPQEAFTVSFRPGSRDEAGRFMGGTEMRVLATHGGKLYAGNGYWEDRPGPEGLQGAEVLVLDGPGARWRVDHVFDELPDGRRRDLAVSALEEVTFATDGNPRFALPGGGTSRLFRRLRREPGAGTRYGLDHPLHDRGEPLMRIVDIRTPDPPRAQRSVKTRVEDR
jgi:hypothetical protein